MKRVFLCGIVLVLMVAVVVTGCSANTATCLVNEAIPQDVRSQNNALNEKTIQAAKNKDFEAFRPLFCTEVLQQGEEAEQNLQSAMILDDLQQMDQYYIRFAKKDNTQLTFSKDVGNPEYLFNLWAAAEEVLVTFSTASSGIFTQVIIQVNVLEDGQWKLYRLITDDYAYHGMKAPEIYEEMLKMQQQNMTVVAGCYGSYLSQVLMPGGLMYYPNHNDMQKLAQTALKAAQEQFPEPKMVETAKGNVEVMYINPVSTLAGLVCEIRYVTEISISDEAEQSELAYALEEVIDEVFPGLTTHFDGLYMQAFNERPSDPQKQYSAYTLYIEENWAL